MEKVAKMLCRPSIYRRSVRSVAPSSAAVNHHSFRRDFTSLPTPHHHRHPRNFPSDIQSPFAMRTGSTRSFSEGISHLPDFKDPVIKNAFKELMAVSWDELPNAVLYDVKKALSKNTDDKAGQEVLANVLRAAEAVEEFIGKLVTLKMDLDDSVGLSGENIKPLSKHFVDALHVAYDRYTAYLSSFGDDEVYLRKKVETELGTRMIHLKMRCSGLGSEWGKVTVLGTSGLSGSYVEQRAS